MIGVDTNVLIRFLTADVEDQHRLAAAFFGSRNADDPAFVSAVTMAETVWVLRRAYGYSATDIGACFKKLLKSEEVELEGREALLGLFDDEFRADQIADYLIAHLGKRAGCSHTVTFDRRAAVAVAGLELLA